MSITKTYDFNDSAEYSFDSNEIEFSAGSVKKKKIIYTNEVVYADFNDGIDANRSVGDGTGTFAGASIIDGHLVCSNNYASYLQENAATVIQKGAVRFKLKPSYDLRPPATYSIYSIGTTTNNEISLAHDQSGFVRVTCRDSSGVVILSSVSFGRWEPSQNVENEIEYNFDFTSGDHRVFINGSLLGLVQGATGIRTLSTTEMRVGRSAIANSTGYSFNTFQLFDEVQHVEDYTIQSGEFNDYSLTNSPVEPINGLTVTTTRMISLAETVTTALGAEIKYTVNIDNIDMFWNGSTWATSSGSSDTNTVAEINTNIVSLDMSSKVLLTITSYISSTIDDTSLLDELIVEYDFAPPFIDINKCNVYCELKDSSGEPIVDAKISFIPNSFWYEGAYIFEEVSVKTDLNGFADIEIVETATTTNTMNIRIEYSNGTVAHYKNKIIPNQENEALANIILT